MKFGPTLAATFVTAASLIVPTALAATAASAQEMRTTAVPAAGRVAAPTATVSADRRYLVANLGRRYRGAKITVKVKLNSKFVSLGAVKLNRDGDARLKVPTKRVKSMRAKLVVRFVKAGKTIGSASTRSAVVARPAPKPTPPPTSPLPPPPPTSPVPPLPPMPTLPDVVPQDFSGAGDQVVSLAASASRPFLATVSGVGTSNFIVWAIDTAGRKSDLVVNEIGNYPTATLLVDVPVGMTIYGFQVTASGTTWTIQVRPLVNATSWTAGQASGQGSTVLATGSVTGVTPLSLSNVGPSNFIVWAHDASGRRLSLLVNVIGAYSGTVVMPVNTRYLSIKSVGGTWGVSRS